MRWSRRASPAAWPSPIWSRCPATPRASWPAANIRSRWPARFGQVTVDYKKYGVGLAFTPTVLGHGLINMKIEPEVSQIDTTHTVAVADGISVPALIVRRASTTVELRDGQSFVIGGLLQTNNQNQIEQLPWLGSVPVLGTLFSSEVLSEEPDRSRHHRDAASGAAGAAGRRHQVADRRHAAAQRPRLLPARQDRGLRGRRRSPHARRRPASPPPATSRSPGTCSTCRGGYPMRPFSNMLRVRSRSPRCSPRSPAARNISIAATPFRSHGGDAVATDKVTQMVDPWPATARQQQHRFQRPSDGKRRRALSHQPRHPAGRHRHLGDLFAGSRRAGQHDAARPDGDAAGGAGEVGGRCACVLAAAPIRAGPAWWWSPPTPNSSAPCARPSAPRSAIDARPRCRAASPNRPTRSTLQDATVVVVDLDAGRADEMAALARPDGARRRLAAGDRGDAELRRRRLPAR